MTQQLINVGVTANDGTGDTPRPAGIKINSNFSELYGFLTAPAANRIYFSDGSNTPTTSSSLTWDGATLNATQFNGVALTTGGSANNFLNESGSYSAVSPTITIREVSTTTAATISDDVILANGTFNVNLPPVATAVKLLTIKSIIGGGTITVDGDGSETIDGSTTKAVTAGTSITIAPSSTGWEII